MNTWLIQKSQKKRRLKARAARFVLKARLGHNALLTLILLLMQIWQRLSIVRTLITPKSLKAGKERVRNGQIKGLGR